MLADTWHAIGGYLTDVFVNRLDGWVILGFTAQALFTMRFLVQWIASERAGGASFPWRSGVIRSAAGCCCWSTRSTAEIRSSLPAKRLGFWFMGAICISFCVSGKRPPFESLIGGLTLLPIVARPRSRRLPPYLGIRGPHSPAPRNDVRFRIPS